MQCFSGTGNNISSIQNRIAQMQVGNTAADQSHIARFVIRSPAADELLAAAGRENHQFELRMPMTRQYETGINDVAERRFGPMYDLSLQNSHKQI